MSNRAVVLLVFVVCVLLGWIGYTTLDRTYLAPRGKLVAKVSSFRSQLGTVEQDRSDAPRINGKLRNVVDRTLGPDLDTVQHHLRRRLNRIGEDIGLTALSVSSGEEKGRGSPAESELPRGDRWKALREELDFIELNGFISGDGTYAQALELLARLDAEPWIKRLYHVKLDPAQGAERFRVSVRLTTLFLPGQSPSQPLPETAPALDQARLAALAAANPFVIPEAPPTVPEIVVANVPPAPSFPYERWVMTGIVTGPGGAEVWLLEAGSGTTKLLTPGDQLAEAKLVHADGDDAQFELAGRTFNLTVGQSLGNGVNP